LNKPEKTSGEHALRDPDEDKYENPDEENFRKNPETSSQSPKNHNVNDSPIKADDEYVQ